jgi:AcrR family transcriptional regulator
MSEAPTLRRDAAANRERILAAAVEVIAASGKDAGIDEIARRAGVGVGTVYRRFPTKEALVQAIVAQLLRDMVASAQHALEVAPELAVAAFLVGAGELQARHAGALPLLWSTGEECQAILEELRATGHQVLERAQAAGAVRDELTYEDLAMALWALRGVIESTHRVEPTLWRRTLELLLHGMKPSPRTLRHPALRSDRLDEVARVGRHRDGR